MIFIEAVSDWNKIDFNRFGDYVLEVLVRFAKSKENFSTVDVEIDFFILNISNDGPDQKVFKLYDLLKVDKNHRVLNDNIKFNVISRKNGNIIKEKILDQYFRFCEIQKEVYLKKGRTKEALEEIIERCIEENVLVDFLEKNKEDVVISIDDANYQERIIKNLIKKEKQESETIGIEKGEAIGIKKGEAIGIEKGTSTTKSEIFRKLINSGMNQDNAYSIVYGD